MAWCVCTTVVMGKLSVVASLNLTGVGGGLLLGLSRHRLVPERTALWQFLVKLRLRIELSDPSKPLIREAE